MIQAFLLAPTRLEQVGQVLVGAAEDRVGPLPRRTALQGAYFLDEPSQHRNRHKNKSRKQNPARTGGAPGWVPASTFSPQTSPLPCRASYVSLERTHAHNIYYI